MWNHPPYDGFNRPDKPDDGLHGYFPSLSSFYGFAQFDSYPVNLLVEQTEEREQRPIIGSIK